MKGSKGPENCTNEREAQALSTFTTQICPVTVKSSDSQRSRASASLGLLERTVWGAAPPRSAGLQSRAVTLRGRGEPHRGACWNAQCAVRPHPDLPGYSQEQWLSEVAGSSIAGPAGTHSAGCGPDCGSLRLHVALTLLAPNPALRPTGQEEGRLTVLLEHLLFFFQKKPKIWSYMWNLNDF